MSERKEFISKQVDYMEFSTSSETNIDEFIKWLTEMKAKGVSKLMWNGDISWGSITEVTCSAYSCIEETDEEFNARLSKEKYDNEVYNNRLESTERVVYEKLKQKFG